MFAKETVGYRFGKPRKSLSPASSLLQAIDAVAKDNSNKNRVRLYRALLDVILIIPVAELPSGLKLGTDARTASLPLQCPLIPDALGSKLIPVFSDIEALRNWDPNTPYIGLKSVELFKIALTTEADRIVINAFGPIRKMIRSGGAVTRHEFQLLAEGRLPLGVVGETVAFNLKPKETVSVARPDKEPKREIVEALLSTARKSNTFRLCIWHRSPRIQTQSG